MAKGDKVRLHGFGTLKGMDEFLVIDKITKTQIILVNPKGDLKYKYRFNRFSGKLVGSGSEYSGHRILPDDLNRIENRLIVESYSDKE